jgi:hypothetical protein
MLLPWRLNMLPLGSHHTQRSAAAPNESCIVTGLSKLGLRACINAKPGQTAVSKTVVW